MCPVIAQKVAHAMVVLLNALVCNVVTTQSVTSGMGSVVVIATTVIMEMDKLVLKVRGTSTDLAAQHVFIAVLVRCSNRSR